MSSGNGKATGHGFGPVFMSKQPNDEHRAVWDWLGDQVEAYPAKPFVPPLRPRKWTSKLRVLWGAELVCEGDGIDGDPRPRSLQVSRDQLLTIQLGGDDVADAAAIAGQLFTHKHRGDLVGFLDGARYALHVLARRYRRAWVDLGYRIRPLGDGASLWALVVSRGRQAWYLADVPSMTGLSREEVDAACSLESYLSSTGPNLPARLSQWLGAYQNTLVANFGTTARLTAGSTAMACALRFVPDDAWTWRPPPDVVAMCRAGGAFRGGHAWYPPYRGGGHKIDLTRAYSWALSQPLPSATRLDRCVRDDQEHDGIYVCDVYGPGTHPVMLGVWRGQGEGFKRGLWSGDHCVAILCSAEFDGMRALGYAIAPSWGYRFERTWSFAPFVEKLEGLLLEHGATSWQGKVAKRLGNAVYGKLAERPERVEMVFAAERPSAEWSTMVTAAGEEVADAWTRQVVSHRQHHHVDLAAIITARVRSRLYEAIAALDERGARVVAADTDGLLTARDPRPTLARLPTGFGGWRYEGYDPELTIAGRQFYTWRGGVRVAGTSPQPADVVAIALARGVVEVEGVVMAPPWSGGAMVRKVRRRLRSAAGGTPG